MNINTFEENFKIFILNRLMYLVFPSPFSFHLLYLFLVSYTVFIDSVYSMCLVLSLIVVTLASASCCPPQPPLAPSKQQAVRLNQNFRMGFWQNSNKSTTHNYPPRYTIPLVSTAISILTTPTYLQSQNLCILNETAELSTVATGLDKIFFKGDGLLVT